MEQGPLSEENLKTRPVAASLPLPGHASSLCAQWKTMTQSTRRATVYIEHQQGAPSLSAQWLPVVTSQKGWISVSLAWPQGPTWDEQS